VSVPTLLRLEAGEPSVSLGVLATALWLIGRDATLATLATPKEDQGALELDVRQADVGKGISLQYGADWLASGFPLSEDLRLVGIEQLPRWKGMAVGAVDDARPDCWGERAIQYIDKPARLSIMEYLFYAGDDRFGALSVSTSSNTYKPRTRNPLPRLEQAQHLSEIVHKVSAKEPINDIERKMLAAGGAPFRQGRCHAHSLHFGWHSPARADGHRTGTRVWLPEPCSTAAARWRGRRGSQPARHARTLSPHGVQHPH